MSEYLPAAQMRQRTRSPDEWRPAAQIEQIVDPLDAVMRPGGQATQYTAAPATPDPSASSALSVAYDPAPQRLQLKAPAVPTKKPDAHALQEDWPLPAAN